MIKAIFLTLISASTFTITAMHPPKRSYSQEANNSLAQSLKNANNFTSQELIQKVKSALEKGADPNSITSYSHVPEHFGPSGEELIFEVPDTIKIIQPLEEAVKLQNLELVKILLEAGANPNIRTNEGNLILINALNNTAMAELLILSGANSTEAFSQLVHESETPQNLQSLKFLINHGADVNAYYLNTTPLLTAVIKGENQKIRLLLTAGANPNLVSKESRTTPLAAAISNKDINAVRLLLENGAKTNIKNVNGNTALDIALKENAGPDIEVLLRNPPQVKKLGLKKI